MARIEDLLHRRTDLSTFLVHLSRDTSDGVGARDHVLSILVDWSLEARSPMGAAAQVAERHREDRPDFFRSQQVACFTETPLEHTWMMCSEIDGRQMQFQPYGVAFTKTWGRLMGLNPVWYLDITPSGRDWLINSVNKIVEEAAQQEDFGHEIFSLTPFIEAMGRLGEDEGRRPKEFWWEREWRLAGDNLWLNPTKLVAVFVPEEDHATFAADLKSQLKYAADFYEGLRYLDPRWGLERMIAALSGSPADLAMPFPPYPPPNPHA